MVYLECIKSIKDRGHLKWRHDKLNRPSPLQNNHLILESYMKQSFKFSWDCSKSIRGKHVYS